MKREYKIIRPGTCSNFEIELVDCIEQLHIFPGKQLISFTIFLEADSSKVFEQRFRKIKDIISEVGLADIPYSIIAQAPVESLILIEVVYSPLSVSIERKKWKEINYNVIKDKYGTELIVSGVGAEHSSTQLGRSAISAFDNISSILKQENFNFDHIVRQWNYIEKILFIHDEEEVQSQNYQLFNEARNGFYSDKIPDSGYPSATGIGIKHGGLVIDFIAWKPSDLAQVYPIDNPQQISSYKYRQDLLIGNHQQQKPKSSPKFERGKLICSNGESTLFVSGTASILGEDTVGICDIKKQTHITLGNIGLIQNESVKHLNGNSQLCENLKNVRVYIKNKEDFDSVRDICQNTFTNVPITYLEADICRDELLVEIEAEYGNDLNRLL